MKKAEAGGGELPGVAAVSRALRILGVFGNDDLSLSLAEISRRTGLYKSTILRLTESLEAFDILVRDRDGSFRLGMELARLGALARRSARGMVEITSTLQAVVEETGESATYYIRRGDMRLALYRVDSSKSLRDNIRPGDLLPLGVGAAGRVLEIKTPAVDPNLKIKAIVSLGERDSEMGAIAGPVYAGKALVGALSVSGPIARFTPENVEAMSAVIERKCQQLSTSADWD